MSQLDFLWELEYKNNQLEEYKRKLVITKKCPEFNQLKLRIHAAKNKHKELIKELEEYKLRIYKNSSLLREYEYKLKKIELDLYEGRVSDIKQLNHLADEKDRLTTKIEEIETTVLTQMENTDLLNEELSRIVDEISSLENDARELRKKLAIIIEELTLQIDNEENNLIILVEKIDTNLLLNYEKIRKLKGTGMAYVENQICSGCNMHIPSFMWEKLKLRDEILHCEYCGRILYPKLED